MINRIINLTIKAKVKILLLSVSSNFDNFSIDICEINTLSAKDYVLIKILIRIIYNKNNIKLKSINLIETLRFLLRIFFSKVDIKEISRALL